MSELPLPNAVPDEFGGERATAALRLHHVGVVVDDLGRAGEEYQSLGYSVCTKVFHDPVQTAYVQFLRLPSDRVLLELVTPDSEKSKLANALKKGGGLNHLCFATDDIEKCWASLRAQGLFPLQRPVPAVAFGGRRIAWFLGRNRVPVELVECVMSEETGQLI